MSLAQQPPPPAPAESPSFLRIIRFPLFVLLVFGGIFATPFICNALHLNSDWVGLPYFFMAALYLAPMLAVVLISLWWIFAFRGLGFFARVGVFIIAVGAFVGTTVVGAPFVVRSFEFTVSPLGMVPRFHFVWDPDPEELFDRQIATGLPAIDATASLEDFPSYRGRKADGVVAFLKLNADWQKNPPEVLWRQPCPGGYSGVAVAGNIAVTMQQHEKTKQEFVVCYDRATGKNRWLYACDTYYKDPMSMGNGPRATPTIHNNHIFTLGATGNLLCLTAEGKLVWSKNILEIAKAKNIKWGMSGSPLIVDDLVIANAGIDPEAETPSKSSLIAFEQATGKIRWQVGNRAAGYSSPQLATLAGTRQILLFDGAGLAGYDPKTGKELWAYPWITQYEMNSIQPVVVGNDRVFISSELDNGCAMIRVNAPDNDKAAWSMNVAWQNKNLAARYANPVTDGKHIFGLHNVAGILTCLDADTGKIRWKGERFGPGQLLLTDGALLVVDGNWGDVTLLDLDGTELALQPVLHTRDKTWNTPALAGDQLFVRNQAEIVCLKLPLKKK